MGELLQEPETEHDEDEQTEFSFAELSPEAQARALDKYREGVWEDWEPSDELEHMAGCLRLLGIDLDTCDVPLMNGKTRSEPDIHYRLSYCQGDGAAFTGNWSAKDLRLAQLAGEVADDDVIHRYGAELLAVYLRYPKAECRIARGMGLLSLSVEVDHETLDLDEDAHCEEIADLAEQLQDIFRACAQWIYDQLRDEADYQTSDENCREGIEANEYLFDGDGDRL